MFLLSSKCSYAINIASTVFRLQILFMPSSKNTHTLTFNKKTWVLPSPIIWTWNSLTNKTAKLQGIKPSCNWTEINSWLCHLKLIWLQPYCWAKFVHETFHNKVIWQYLTFSIFCTFKWVMQIYFNTFAQYFIIYRVFRMLKSKLTWHLFI